MLRHSPLLRKNVSSSPRGFLFPRQAASEKQTTRSDRPLGSLSLRAYQPKACRWAEARNIRSSTKRVESAEEGRLDRGSNPRISTKNGLIRTRIRPFFCAEWKFRFAQFCANVAPLTKMLYSHKYIPRHLRVYRTYNLISLCMRWLRPAVGKPPPSS